MKAIIILLFLGLGSLVIANAPPICDIKNFHNFINKPGVHKCYLAGADFSGQNLQRANLAGADLQAAKFEGADLSYANLQKAQVHAELVQLGVSRERLIEPTNFTGAILKGADLRGAWFNGTIFTGADLSGAIVTKRQAKYLKEQGVSGFIVKELPPNSSVGGSKDLEDKHKTDRDELLRTLNRRLAKKIKDSELNIACRYVPVDPVYIKTKGCGGICSGVVKCKYQIDEPYSFSVAIACESVGDDCPSANDCFKAKKPEKTFFVGTPSEYKEKHKKNTIDSDLINAPSIKKSGGTK